MSRFLGREFRVDSLDQQLYSDYSELTEERSLTDSCPMWIAVVHFFNHQTHHRGQLTTLLSRSGLDPGVTGLIWLPGATSGDGR